RPEGANRYFVRDVPPSFIFSSRYSIRATVGRFACFDACAEKLSGTIEVASVDGFSHFANVACWPARTSGDVRFCAAVRGLADATITRLQRSNAISTTKFNSGTLSYQCASGLFSERPPARA